MEATAVIADHTSSISTEHSPSVSKTRVRVFNSLHFLLVYILSTRLQLSNPLAAFHTVHQQFPLLPIPYVENAFKPDRYHLRLSGQLDVRGFVMYR